MRIFKCPQCEWENVHVEFRSKESYGADHLKCQCVRCKAWWEENTSVRLKADKDKEIRDSLIKEPVWPKGKEIKEGEEFKYET